MRGTPYLSAAFLAFALSGSAGADCTTQQAYQVNDDGRQIPIHTAECDTTQLEMDANLAIQNDLCVFADDEETCRALLAASATAVRDHQILLELAKGTSITDIATLTGASTEEITAMQLSQ